MEEGSLPTYSVNEVLEGFKSRPDLLVRTEVINSEETLKTVQKYLQKYNTQRKLESKFDKNQF